MFLWRHRFSQKAMQLFYEFLPYYIKLGQSRAKIQKIIALVLGRMSSLFIKPFLFLLAFTYAIEIE